MKVLREGKKDDWKWIGKCPDCDAIVEADTRELKSNITCGDYRSDFEAFAWHKCPECIGRICFHEVISKSGQEVLEEVKRHN